MGPPRPIKFSDGVKKAITKLFKKGSSLSTQTPVMDVILIFFYAIIKWVLSRYFRPKQIECRIAISAFRSGIIAIRH